MIDEPPIGEQGTGVGGASVVDRIVRRLSSASDHPVLTERGLRSYRGEDLLQLAADRAIALAARGAGPGSRVGLQIPLSANYVAYAIAAWTLGAAVVPLASTDPPARLQQLLTEGSVDLLASGDAESGLILEVVGRPVPRQWTDEAYILFTSGSTGQPKGVSVGHRSLAAYLEASERSFGVADERMVCPAVLPTTFDAVMTSILLPLVRDMELVTFPSRRSVTWELLELVREADRPLLVKTTPTQLGVMRSLLGEPNRWSGSLVIGGEPLSFDELNWLRSAASLRIFNEYGPTEATIGCSVHEVTDADPDRGPVPLGTPHPGVRFVRDESLGGELLIVGACLANGYVNGDPSASFTTLDDGTPCYRTGDRVRAEAGGLYFAGRFDDQVKVHGHRVDPVEIESVAREVTGKQCGAVVEIDRVVLFVAGDPGDHVESLLAARLPFHMRPSELVLVPHLPMTENGKVDRAALRRRASGVPDPAALNAGEVAVLWGSLVGAPPREDDDFFAVGGESIAALRLAGELSARSGIEIPAALIFDSPVFGDFVAQLEAFALSKEQADLDPAPRSALTPAAAIVADDLKLADGAYTVVDAVEVSGVQSWDDIVAAAGQLLERVPMLRARFVPANDGDARLILVPQPIDDDSIEIHDLTGLGTHGAIAEVDRRLTLERRTSVSIIGPGRAPTRFLSFALTTSTRIFALVTHHALVDERTCEWWWTQLFAPDGDQGTVPITDFVTLSPSEAADLVARISAGPLHPAVGVLSETSTSTGWDHLERVLDTSHPATETSAGVAIALSRRFDSDRFIVSVPMTARRLPREFDAPGCQVTHVPVVVDMRGDPDRAEAIRRWSASIRVSTALSRSCPTTIRSLLTELYPGSSSWRTVSISTSKLRAGSIDGVRWSSIPVAPGPPRSSLAVLLRATQNARSVTTLQIVWRTSEFDRATCLELADEIERWLDTSAAEGAGSMHRPDSRSGHPLSADSMAELVGEALTAAIGPDDDLFERGAQSLDLVWMIGAILERHGVEMTFVDLLDNATPRDLARLVAVRRTHQVDL